MPRLRGAAQSGAPALARRRSAAPRTGSRILVAAVAAARRRRSRSCSLFPLVATPFFTFQIGAQALALGLIALSLTFLGGYGGMVSLAQMTVAGIAGYMVAILGTSSTDRDQPRLAVVAGGAARDRHRDRRRGVHRLALGAHRGHLHDHDHARDRRRLLLPGAAELQRLQRLPGPAARCYPPTRVRHRLARSGAVLLPGAGLRAGRLLLRHVPGALAVRHRAAGHPRQPAPHERARLQRHRAPRRRLRGRRRASRPSAACCSSGTTG